MHAIKLRSGKGYEAPKWPEGTGPSAQQTDRSARGSNSRQEKEIDRSPARIDRSVANNAPTSTRVDPFDVEDFDEVLRNPEHEEPPVQASKPMTAPVPAAQREAPFPVRRRNTMREKEYDRMKSVVGDLQVKLPFVEAVKMVPCLKKLMKDILTNKASLEQGAMHLTHECSAILQDQLPEKREDPGPFTLPCSIGDMEFKKCLCDLGASVSLMPLSVAQRLGLFSFKPTRVTLILADRSTRRPEGVIENLPVQIGNSTILTDFIVLKLDKEPRNPIILGRPFLATAGALINVQEGKIELRMDNLIMEFNLEQLAKNPTIDGQTFQVDAMEELAEEVCAEVCSTDYVQTALTKSTFELSFRCSEITELICQLDNAPVAEREAAVLPLEKGATDPPIGPTDPLIGPTDPPIGSTDPVCSINTEAREDGPIDRDLGPIGPTLKNPSKPEDDWSEASAPKLELKPLPAGLKYAYLGPNSTYPVIINANLSNVETTLLLSKLRMYRKALGYSLDDITGISPELCTHRIHLEDPSKSSIENQRRLNPNLREVVKKEILKLLAAGIIYPISDSTWVSPVHVVPKKVV